MQPILPITVHIKSAARQRYDDGDGVVRCKQTLRGLFTPNDSITVTIRLWAAPLIFLTGTVIGRIGCIPIVPVNVTFLMESFGVNRPY